MGEPLQLAVDLAVGHLGCLKMFWASFRATIGYSDALFIQLPSSFALFQAQEGARQQSVFPLMSL